MRTALKIWLAASFFLIFLLPACKKHRHEEVRIDILSPSQGATVSNPFLLHVKFSAEETIHDLSVEIKDLLKPGDPTVYLYSNHVHQKNFELRDSLFISVPEPRELHLKATAGEGQHVTSKTQTFFVTP